MSELIRPQAVSSALKVTSSVARGDSIPSTQTAIVTNLPGTRSSIQNNQLLTPIGIPSIDFFLGGGIAIGSVCLMIQDRKGIYADLLNRCFIAEGVCHKHALYISDPNEDTETILHKIPSVNKIDDLNASKNDQNLRIAWRYAQKADQQQSSSSAAVLDSNSSKTLNHNYFRNENFLLKADVCENCNLKSFSFDKNSKPTTTERGTVYSRLALDLKNYIDSLNLNVLKTKSYTNVMRVVLNSLGNLAYNDLTTLNDDHSIDLCKFLLNIRSVMRHSLAVCLVSLPNEFSFNKELIEKIVHLADYAFIMDDSVKTVSSITNTEYDGLFRLVKIPCLNSLNVGFKPPSLDLGFFYRKRRLVVEQMHLVPDIGDDSDKQKGRTNTSICGADELSGSSQSSIFKKNVTNSKLDF